MTQPAHAKSTSDSGPPDLPKPQRRRGTSRTSAGRDRRLGCVIGLLVGGVAALLLVTLASGIGVVVWFRLTAPTVAEAANPVLAEAPAAGARADAGDKPAPRQQARGMPIGKEEHAKELAAPPHAPAAPPRAPAAPPRAPAAITGDPEMDRVLCDLEAADGAVRKAATDRLVRMRPNQHRAVVAKKLAERLPLVEPFDQGPLIHALSVWATAAEVPALIQLLDSPEIHIRNVTLDALGKLRDERAVKPIVRCFKELHTRWHSEQALKALGPMAEKEVLALLKQPDRDLWVPAIYVLAEIGTEQSLPALREASKQFATKGVAEGAMSAIQKRLSK